MIKSSNLYFHPTSWSTGKNSEIFGCFNTTANSLKHGGYYEQSMVMYATPTRPFYGKIMAEKFEDFPPFVVVLIGEQYKSEYTYLRGCPGHYDHDRCMDGLKAFVAENERRIREGVTEADPFHVLLFSEWGMFCSISDRRTREEAIAIVAAQIMSVRAQGMSVWLDLQRPDSQFMGTARDSLAPIALGNLSPEGKRMAFPDFANEIEPVGPGEGYFSDGVTLQKIIVPTVTRWDILHEDVKKLVE